MTALYILGGIFLVFFAIAMIRAEVIIKYADDFGLAVRICGIKLTIMPRKPKKVRPREKAELKKQGKVKKKPLGETISLILALVKTAVGRFAKHLRVRVARLHINVATGDAASTAILYGTVAQSAAYIAALLDSTKTLKNAARADVDIHADYLSEKTTADIEIGFSLRVWQVIDILIRTGITFIKKEIRK